MDGGDGIIGFKHSIEYKSSLQKKVYQYDLIGHTNADITYNMNDEGQKSFTEIADWVDANIIIGV